MILLLGGTSETAPLAEALAEAGYDVLVSTATDVPLFVGNNPKITHRHGRLTVSEMTDLVRQHRVTALVDATHPYASGVHATATQVADSLIIPCFTFLRPVSPTDQAGIQLATDHAEAAEIACAIGRPILLTIGSNHVAVYTEAAKRAGIPLVARVLPHPDSIRHCREAGLPDARVITGRGPFSLEENRELIRRFQIGVLVTKESGAAGGVPEKLEAARLEGCQVVMVGRPTVPVKNVFQSIPALVEALKTHIIADRTN